MPISLRQANRFLLKRQHLLEPTNDPLQAAIDACGLQAQIPSAPALSLRARVAGFTLADYDRMLKQERSLVRTWAMRGTVHTVPAARLSQYIKLQVGFVGYLAAPSAQREEDAALTLSLLAERPASRKELSRIAQERGLLTQERADQLFGAWGGILRYLALTGETVHLPDEGRDVRLIRVADWLGAPVPDEPFEVLEDRILADYLAGYGPATIHDFAKFMAMQVAKAKEIFKRAKGLVEVELEGSNRAHYLPEALLPELLATTGEEEAPVQLLPRFDSILLAHQVKDRILHPEDFKKVFKPAAVVDATVLVDGWVAGTWTATQTTKALRFQFHPFRRTALRPIKAAAARLADWYGLELDWLTS